LEDKSESEKQLDSGFPDPFFSFWKIDFLPYQQKKGLFLLPNSVLKRVVQRGSSLPAFNYSSKEHFPYARKRSMAQHAHSHLTEDWMEMEEELSAIDR